MKNAVEIWKDIQDYEGRYQISSQGQVKSLNRKANHTSGERIVSERILKNQRQENSYNNVSLSKDGKMKRFTVHRLVANAFISNPENKPQVNHIDGNKQNNSASNLEWVTSQQNNTHAYKLKLKLPPNKDKYGEFNHNSKLIVQYSKSGDVIKKYGSTREANRITCISQGDIAACARGKRKSAGGYKWKYEPKYGENKK